MEQKNAATATPSKSKWQVELDQARAKVNELEGELKAREALSAQTQRDIERFKGRLEGLEVALKIVLGQRAEGKVTHHILAVPK